MIIYPNKTLNPYKPINPKHKCTNLCISHHIATHARKLHAFQELNWFMAKTLYSARFRHCYRDEDMMGVVKSLCRRVHRNMLEWRVLTRLLLRYRYCTPRSAGASRA